MEQERFQGTLEDWRRRHQLEFCWQPVPWFCVQVSAIHGCTSDLQQEIARKQVHRLFAQSSGTYVTGFVFRP